MHRQAARFKIPQADGKCNLAPILNYMDISWVSVGYSRFFYTQVLVCGDGANTTVVCLIFELRRVEHCLTFCVNSVWSCDASVSLH